MKRLISILMICIMAAAVSITAFAENTGTTSAPEEQVITWGQAAEERGLVNIKSNLYYAEVDEWTGMDVPVLRKSRTIKNCFVLKADEQLVIPSGRTLKLTGGADIDGTIYIEKGGKLIIDKLSVALTGDIVCFGTISVTNGTLTCFDESMLYVAEGGKFTASDCGGSEGDLNTRIYAEHGADVDVWAAATFPTRLLPLSP